MLDADDKQFLTLLVENHSQKVSKEAIEDHTKVTHGPLDIRVTEAKTAADDATKSASGARKFVLFVAAVCTAIGAAVRGAFTGGH